MSNFGMNIKKIRSLKNYTQQDLGDILGLTRAAVSSYEEGRAEPKIETLVRAAQIFEVSMDDLINKKLTVNELSNFKVPVIENKPAKPLVTPLFPSDANWISISDAVIVDKSFECDQILLAKLDELHIHQPQIIQTKTTIYVAGEKKVAKEMLILGQTKIPLTDIINVQTIVGFYQPLNNYTKNVQTELASIRARLDALEQQVNRR